MDERDQRIARLIARGLSRTAAEIVIDAAMYGKGCIDERYRNQLAADVTSTSIPV